MSASDPDRERRQEILSMHIDVRGNQAAIAHLQRGLELLGQAAGVQEITIDEMLAAHATSIDELAESNPAVAEFNEWFGSFPADMLDQALLSSDELLRRMSDKSATIGQRRFAVTSLRLQYMSAPFDVAGRDFYDHLVDVCRSSRRAFQRAICQELAGGPTGDIERAEAALRQLAELPEVQSEATLALVRSGSNLAADAAERMLDSADETERHAAWEYFAGLDDEHSRRLIESRPRHHEPLPFWMSVAAVFFREPHPAWFEAFVEERLRHYARFGIGETFVFPGFELHDSYVARLALAEELAGVGNRWGLAELRRGLESPCAGRVAAALASARSVRSRLAWRHRPRSMEGNETAEEMLAWLKGEEEGKW